MQKRAISLPIDEGPMSRFELKGRCKRCWGHTRGRTDKELNVNGIRCLVCNLTLEGEQARLEDERTFEEATINALNMDWGHTPKYADGPFAFKVFPPSRGVTEGELGEKCSSALRRYSKSPRGKLTRHDFPVGSAGRLFIQAKLLIDGVGYFDEVRGNHLAEFPEIEPRSVGSATVHFDMTGVSENPNHRADELLRNMGSLMGSAMMSAFSCELALKAIALATNDEAWREHDLSKLFHDLPDESRRRLVSDFTEIEAVMAQSRLTFGAWRYFESDVSNQALRAIVDARHARQLAKAARVILDEATYVGLYGKVAVRAHRKTATTGDTTTHDDDVQVTVTGGERPREV